MKYLYNAFGINLSSDSAIPFLRDGHSPISDFEITVIRHYICEYNECGYQYDVLIDNSPYYIASYDDKNEAMHIYVDDDKIFNEVLSGRVFAPLLFDKGYFILHASVVVYGGQAYVFSGDSHAGKSTIAFAAHKYLNATIIGDDMAVIKLIDGKPYVFSGSKKTKLRTEARMGLATDSDTYCGVGVTEDIANYITDNRDNLYPLRSVVFLNRTERIDHFEYKKYTDLKSRIYLCMNLYNNAVFEKDYSRSAFDFAKNNCRLFHCYELSYPDDINSIRRLCLPEQ